MVDNEMTTYTVAVSDVINAVAARLLLFESRNRVRDEETGLPFIRDWAFQLEGCAGRVAAMEAKLNGPDPFGDGLKEG